MTLGYEPCDAYEVSVVHISKSYLFFKGFWRQKEWVHIEGAAKADSETDSFVFTFTYEGPSDSDPGVMINALKHQALEEDQRRRLPPAPDTLRSFVKKRYPGLEQGRPTDKPTAVPPKPPAGGSNISRPPSAPPPATLRGG